MLTAATGVVPTHHVHIVDPSVDRSMGVRRLRRHILNLLEAYPFAEVIGRDALVEELAESHFLDRHEVTVVRTIIAQQRVTVVGVLSAVWTCEVARGQLLALRASAKAKGRRILLVLERSVRRQPRLANARVLAGATGTSVTADDRFAVIQHLVTEGPSTLHRCACVVRNSAPYSAILSMAAEGIIGIDLDRRLMPETVVDLATRRAA